MVEKIITRSGITIYVEKRVMEDEVELSLRMEKHERCLLHWGLSHDIHTPWQIPPQSVWPEGSCAFDRMAVQTPFWGRNGEGEILFRLNKILDFSLIDFVLFFPDEGRWDNNHGRNYQIKIPGSEKTSSSPIQTLKEEIRDGSISYEHVHNLENEGQLAVLVTKDEALYHITLITDIPGPLILHWGVAKHFRYEWCLPPSSMYPPETTAFQGKAAETPFADHAGFRRLHLRVRKQEAPVGIPFVLKHVDTGRWLKDHGRNFYLPLGAPEWNEASLGLGLASLAHEIIEKEMSPHSWTLMHRFNLCYDLLDKVRDDVEGLALIFVWLRFSAIRQLDWQRNYNTKPRELSHAQDRLTTKLANLYTNEPAARQFIRLIMATLGRGGEGQQIRDEILRIMHRHNIKEVSGSFMEEWHQKLHNNTTPDDVTICDAYLEFLRSDGDLEVFYGNLEAGGVTKERLESYERPIKSHPDFIPHLKDALIHDSEHFLRVLKAVHSGTDLETAIDAARYLFDGEMSGLMDFLRKHRGDGQVPVCTLAEKITEARRRLTRRLGEHPNGVRDLLFLDIALEDFLRVVVERNFHMRLSADQLVELIANVLENLCLSGDNKEFEYCLRHWERLREMPRFGKKWSIQAEALIDRLGRALSALIDLHYQLFQREGEFLGAAFNADSWAITNFGEEVVRGRPIFVLSMLVSYLNPILRKSAGLGDWQVISRGRGTGQVEVVSDLRSIQGRTFGHPTIIVTDEVAGDEEMPEGVTAIITSDTTDIVSHIAIRARNARLLFATCYDSKIVERLKALRGRQLKLTVTAAGDVRIQESPEEVIVPSGAIQRVRAPISYSGFTCYAMSRTDFNERDVGGKSHNLNRLHNKLPEWISLPTSVALPFGVFEKVLTHEKNKEVMKHYKELTCRVNNKLEKVSAEMLQELRKTILALHTPDELVSSIQKVIGESGLGLLTNWDDAWMCIKRVWSSKWNERAYLSRRARGIPHEDLLMAVLIQEVVEADYSFVIHTVNPLTGDSSEIYAEVVLGLGETLVGNYPGRALSFTCGKGKQKPELLAFPSKSVGLFGKGLIFRSDSNGEDLAGYAGAGIYDSVMLEPAHEITLDYAREPLVWDEDFRRSLLVGIATIGRLVEEALGTPQDIEGGYAKDQYYIVQTRPQVGTEDA